ncbi:uncharacterized protein LOC144643055 [Oculina patagonica]
MWFQTLKTRHSVRSFSTENSQGLVVGLEYTDRKNEIHALKRETSPLSLEEGVNIAFVIHENDGMSLLGICQSGKGKCCLEIRAWDVMSSLGFAAKEIAAQDLQKSAVNDGKFKAIVNLPEALGTHFSLKIAVLQEFVSVAVSSGLIIIWKCRKAENQTVILELISVMKSSMTIQDIAFVLDENNSKKGPPSLVVGESGGVKLYTAAQNTDVNSDDGEVKFIPSQIPFSSSDIGNAVQDIQLASPSSCVVSDSSGQLWYLNPPHLQEIMLPSSQGGHSVFAVQAKHGQTEGWLATVDQSQTINLYKLCDVIKSTEAGLIAQAWHMILSQHPISTLSFIEDNVLAGGSNSVKYISLWVGIDNIGTSRLETG